MKRRKRRTPDDGENIFTQVGKVNRKKRSERYKIIQYEEAYEWHSNIWRMENEEQILIKMMEIVGEFQNDIYEQIGNGWDGEEPESPRSKWSFAGAMLYAITTISTIGIF